MHVWLSACDSVLTYTYSHTHSHIVGEYLSAQINAKKKGCDCWLTTLFDECDLQETSRTSFGKNKTYKSNRQYLLYVIIWRITLSTAIVFFEIIW